MNGDHGRPRALSAERRVASELVFDGRLIRVRLDTVLVGSDDRRSRREVVEHGGAVAIVPVTPGGGVVLVRQFRYAVGMELLEVPAGTLEAGENPEACARRELAEETGYRPAELHYLASVYTSPGFCSEEIHLFLALVEPSPGEPRPDEGEDLTVEVIPLREAVAMAVGGRMPDAKSVTALLMADARLALLRPELRAGTSSSGDAGR